MLCVELISNVIEHAIKAKTVLSQGNVIGQMLMSQNGVVTAAVMFYHLYDVSRDEYFHG